MNPSYSVSLVYLGPIRSTLVLLGPFGSLWSHSIHFGPHCSYLVHSVHFSPIWSYSVHFGSIRSIRSNLVHSAHFGLIWSTFALFDSIRSTLVLFGPFCKLGSNIGPIWTILPTSAQFGTQFNLVLFGSFGQLWSYMVHFGPTRSICIWSYLVYFGPSQSYLVHYIYFGPIQSTLFHFCLIWSTSIN